jgi:hypothetical protein
MTSHHLYLFHRHARKPSQNPEGPGLFESRIPDDTEPVTAERIAENLERVGVYALNGLQLHDRHPGNYTHL